MSDLTSLSGAPQPGSKALSAKGGAAPPPLPPAPSAEFVSKLQSLPVSRPASGHAKDSGIDDRKLERLLTGEADPDVDDLSSSMIDTSSGGTDKSKSKRSTTGSKKKKQGSFSGSSGSKKRSTSTGGAGGRLTAGTKPRDLSPGVGTPRTEDSDWDVAVSDDGGGTSFRLAKSGSRGARHPYASPSRASGVPASAGSAPPGGTLADEGTFQERVQRWYRWLGLDPKLPADAPYMKIAEARALKSLPDSWRFVDGEYLHVWTGTSQSEHPMVEEALAELEAMRGHKSAAPGSYASASGSRMLKAGNAVSDNALTSTLSFSAGEDDDESSASIGDLLRSRDSIHRTPATTAKGAVDAGRRTEPAASRRQSSSAVPAPAPAAAASAALRASMDPDFDQDSTSVSIQNLSQADLSDAPATQVPGTIVRSAAGNAAAGSAGTDRQAPVIYTPLTGLDFEPPDASAGPVLNSSATPDKLLTDTSSVGTSVAAPPGLASASAGSSVGGGLPAKGLSSHSDTDKLPDPGVRVSQTQSQQLLLPPQQQQQQQLQDMLPGGPVAAGRRRRAQTAAVGPKMAGFDADWLSADALGLAPGPGSAATLSKAVPLVAADHTAGTIASEQRRLAGTGPLSAATSFSASTPAAGAGGLAAAPAASAGSATPSPAAPATSSPKRVGKTGTVFEEPATGSADAAAAASSAAAFSSAQHSHAPSRMADALPKAQSTSVEVQVNLAEFPPVVREVPVERVVTIEKPVPFPVEKIVEVEKPIIVEREKPIYIEKQVLVPAPVAAPAATVDTGALVAAAAESAASAVRAASQQTIDALQGTIQRLQSELEGLRGSMATYATASQSAALESAAVSHQSTVAVEKAAVEIGSLKDQFRRSLEALSVERERMTKAVESERQQLAAEQNLLDRDRGMWSLDVESQRQKIQMRREEAESAMREALRTRDELALARRDADRERDLMSRERMQLHALRDKVDADLRLAGQQQSEVQSRRSQLEELQRSLAKEKEDTAQLASRLTARKKSLDEERWLLARERVSSAGTAFLSGLGVPLPVPAGSAVDLSTVFRGPALSVRGDLSRVLPSFMRQQRPVVSSEALTDQQAYLATLDKRLNRGIPASGSLKDRLLPAQLSAPPGASASALEGNPETGGRAAAKRGTSSDGRQDGSVPDDGRGYGQAPPPPPQQQLSSFVSIRDINSTMGSTNISNSRTAMGSSGYSSGGSSNPRSRNSETLSWQHGSSDVSDAQALRSFRSGHAGGSHSDTHAYGAGSDSAVSSFVQLTAVSAASSGAGSSSGYESSSDRLL